MSNNFDLLISTAPFFLMGSVLVVNFFGNRGCALTEHIIPTSDVTADISREKLLRLFFRKAKPKGMMRPDPNLGGLGFEIKFFHPDHDGISVLNFGETSFYIVKGDKVVDGFDRIEDGKSSRVSFEFARDSADEFFKELKSSPLRLSYYKNI